MSVRNAMFLFEVVVDSVDSNVPSRQLMIKSDFANIFSLELKDPKQMQIVIPEPPPLPPDTGKKGKKKKPKLKGKKGKIPPPPPEPVIQAGQSVLFTSSAEILLQNMKKFPLELSLWSGEDNLVCIASTLVPWDPAFESYLISLYNNEPAPAVTIRDYYNLFEEGTAKRLVKIGLQVKLSCLNDKVTTAFRTLSEDPDNKKYLYTGVNSKTTSYVCTMKTTDEDFKANCNKVENNFLKINYADFKNAPGANLGNFFQEGDYCCMKKADKPPDSKYVVPETAPDIDFIVDYIRKVIISCNDNLRMLTPRSTIRPRAKATDIDKFCYCQEAAWPQGKLAERFKREAQSEACPVCIDAGRKPKGSRAHTFDISNIRGLCGRTDCRIARDLKAYIENLIEEDDREININEIIGPCGSKYCTLADKIQQFLRHETEFRHGITKEGLSTQCACLSIMQKSLMKTDSCVSICDAECNDSDESSCGGDKCPFRASDKSPVHDVYYFTVEYDIDPNTSKSTPGTPKSQSDSSQSHPDTPKSQPDTPKSQPDTPKSRPDTPITQPGTPKSDSAKSEPGTPKSEPSTPKSVPGSPKSEPGTPKSDLGTPKSEPDSPKSAKGSSKTKLDTPKSAKDSSKTKLDTPKSEKGSSKAQSDTSKSEPTSLKPEANVNEVNLEVQTPKSQSNISKSDSHGVFSSNSEVLSASTHSKYKYCSMDCPTVSALEDPVCTKSTCSNLTIKKETVRFDTGPAKETVCPTKETFSPSPADSKVVLNIDDIYNPCCVKTCEVADKIKDFIVETVTSRTAKSAMQEKDPCFCDCDCNFHFTQKTTYCAVCGGYECLGDDMKDQPIYARAHPCPVYNKLYDNKFIKVPQAWPDKLQEKKQVEKNGPKGAKSVQKAPESKKPSTMMLPPSEKGVKKEPQQREKKPNKGIKKISKFTENVEQPPPPKKRKPKKRHKFVPQDMGWQWDADDIPGLEFRPLWKPGAAKKALVKRYRDLIGGDELLAKKKRAMMQRKKKLEMKPTLIIKKVAGEITVQMEVYKKYSKDRLLHQYPFEEQPPIMYTVGKTAEEKRVVQAKKDRRERRDARRKKRLLQSTFRDRCQEICVKAYNQALGLLPLPDPNHPSCPCMNPPPISPPIDSCSCSDEDISTSDTDNDEWTVEFFPPASRWNQKAKHPPVLVENESQYTYLDYKVKLLDKQGNPIPRFFTGPDGNEVCSDLGGFWGPDHLWNDINKDGYIGPDNRWVPMNFTGPDGMHYSAEEGHFTDTQGQRLVIGIDGYLDADAHWIWYKKLTKNSQAKSKSTPSSVTKSDIPVKETIGKTEMDKKVYDKKANSGHTTKVVVDSKTATVCTTLKKHEPSEGAKPSKAILSKRKNPVVMNVAVEYARNNVRSLPNTDYLTSADSKKFARYCEIMEGLEMYDDLVELKPPAKANRASNTSKEKKLGKQDHLNKNPSRNVKCPNVSKTCARSKVKVL